MNTPKDYEAPRISSVEDFAQDYADNCMPILSLQIQRAYIEGALKGFELARLLVVNGVKAANDPGIPPA